MAGRIGSTVIENVQPQIDCGRHPVKSAVGEPVRVTADVFKEGHDDGTANYALCLDARRDCILILSNSVRAEHIIVMLVNRLLGPVNLPAEWEGYAPAKP